MRSTMSLAQRNEDIRQWSSFLFVAGLAIACLWYFNESFQAKLSSASSLPPKTTLEASIKPLDVESITMPALDAPQTPSLAPLSRSPFQYHVSEERDPEQVRQ